MRRIAFTLFAVAAILISGSSAALATPGDPHQVWVCKYAGQPGDFEKLKPGKQPILVDVAAADAYVGADFADGQTHSFVIAIATDENTGQGEKYTGDAACPTPPSISPSIEPSESPTPSEQPSETPSVTPPAPSPSDSPSVSPTPKPSETPSTSSSPTSKPSSKPTPERRVITPPSTDTEPASTAAADSTTFAALLILFAVILSVLYWRPSHR